MPARLRSLAAGALIGVAALLGRAHAQDATALKALFHPATRACVNSDNEDFFEFLFGNDLRFESDLKDGYKLTSFDTADPSIVDGNAMGGMFPQPVTPTHQFQIDTAGRRSLTIVN